MFFSKFFDFSLNFHRSISDYCRYFDECHTRISTALENSPCINMLYLVVLSATQWSSVLMLHKILNKDKSIE